MRNFEDTPFVSEQYPDLIPRNFENFVEVKDNVKKVVVKDESENRNNDSSINFIYNNIFTLSFPPTMNTLSKFGAFI